MTKLQHFIKLKKDLHSNNYERSASASGSQYNFDYTEPQEKLVTPPEYLKLWADIKPKQQLKKVIR